MSNGDVPPVEYYLDRARRDLQPMTWELRDALVAADIITAQQGEALIDAFARQGAEQLRERDVAAWALHQARPARRSVLARLLRR